MKKLALTCALVALAVTSPAMAEEARISVSEVHDFVGKLNTAVNTPEVAKTRGLLDSMISDNAIFDTNFQGRYLNYGTWVNTDVLPYAYGYRYPLTGYVAPQYAPIGFRTLNKVDTIAALEHKKDTIPGYQGRFVVTNVDMSPTAESAMADVNFSEFGAASGPFAPYYAYSGLVSASKCKIYLRKNLEMVYLTRMDCNTNSNLPL